MGIELRAGCRRCAVLCLALLLAACGPSAPEARQYTVGVVNLSPQLDMVLDGFKAGLRDMGYSDREVIYLYEGPAPTIQALDERVQRLLEAKVDLILALSTPAAQAAQRLTARSRVPVVFAPVTDPLSAGIVASLSHPGANVTGVALGSKSEAQRLQWLLRVAPNVSRIYVPYNPGDDSATSSVSAIREAADKLGVELALYEAASAEAISHAIEAIPADVQAVVLPQDSLVAARIDDFAAACTARRLPLSTPTDGQVERGALISYSFRLTALGRQAARLADQIFKGTPPTDLPVETAEFFLTINLRTADAIGLTIPPEVLRAADYIIR